MHYSLRRSLALVVCLVALLAGAIGPALAQDAALPFEGDHPFAALGLPEIQVTITETAFEGVPTELPAGRYVLSVTNALAAGEGPAGPEASGINFLRLRDRLTAEDFMAQVASYGDPLVGVYAETTPVAAEAGPMAPDWLYQVTLPGGPYALPGETASAVIDLTAGAWVLWGEVPGAPQPPVTVTVTGETPGDVPMVAADVQITMVEYAFVVPTPLPAGPQIIELANLGQEPHFFTLARVPPGTTQDDALAAFMTRYADAATPVAGGVRAEDLTVVFVPGTQSSGVTAWYAADLAPGTYLAVCFIPDPVNGIPHVMLGMTQMVEVV